VVTSLLGLPMGLDLVVEYAAGFTLGLEHLSLGYSS
jgi:hypothetical protein